MRLNNSLRATLLCGLALIVGSGASTAIAGKKTPGTGPNSVFLEDLTTAELKQRIDTGCTVAIIFSGSTEETGPHVALGKHQFRARAYGERIARGVGDAVVAPILPFAPNGPPLDSFAGTISLAPQTFIDVNEQVARSLIGNGFRRVALLSDHGSGQKALDALATKLDAEFAPQGARVFYIADGYVRARIEIEAEIRASGRDAHGHGGIWDTAETMAVKPSAVRRNLLHAAGPVPEGGRGVGTEGFADDPRSATAADGRRWGALRVSLATAELKADLAAAGACRKPA